MANPRWTETSVPRSLPDRVAQLYYAHGLFCATHPYIVIFLALSLTLLCCYPLLSLPLPGNVPQQYASNGNNTLTDAPRWFQASSPVCYVQQVVMKTAVSPWSDDFLLTDAYRAPLAEVFSLVEVIHNYQHENSSLTLSDVCFHVESAKSKKQRPVLPEFGCLVLSPANFWRQDVHRYTSDTNLISTIYSYQNFQKGKVSLSEVLFGLNMKDTGIKRYPLRKRQRIIQFAVTIVLRHYDKQFIDGLHDRLARLYPLHQKSTDLDGSDSGSGNSSDDSTLHIYYPGEFDYAELAPLSGIYALLFAYVYFFLRKIELVRSKVGIALSAVMTVVSSLAVTLGICFFFGLELAGCGRGRESILLQMFPYLVVTVGFENVIVLTKSVVTTAPHLDVKIRIAQGLSREGWSMTKTLLIEVTIFTVGLLTLVPDIQEFCIFAIVGSLVDFFLQIFLYTTILGLDIRQQADSPVEPTTYSSLQLRYSSTSNGSLATSGGMSRSRSHPRLNSGNTANSGVSATGGIGQGGGGGGGGSDAQGGKIPKRLKLANFWARTRFVQHAFMLCMCVWIGGILYNAGMLQRFTGAAGEAGQVDIGKPLTLNPAGTRDPRVSRFKPTAAEDPEHRAAILDMEKKFLASQKHSIKQLKDDSSDLAALKPSAWEPWQRVSAHHWSALLALHNNSHVPATPPTPTYVTLLPAIRLATVITPQRALQLRNPFEKQQPPLQWHSLALALDPLDSLTGAAPAQLPSKTSPSPLLPSSPMELFLAMLLCLTSIMVVSYTVLVLYRCICSRNYAEWRASWSPSEGSEEGTGGAEDVVLEAVPLILSDTTTPQQQVECVASDGGRIVASVCLAGELRCWDAATGELIVTARRAEHFGGGRRRRQRHTSGEEGSEEDDGDGEGEVDCRRMSKTEADDNDRLYHELATTMTHHNSSSSSSMVVRNRHHKNHQWDLPDLSSTINTNFTSVTYQPSSNYHESAPDRTAVVHHQSNYDGSVLDRTTGDRHQSNYNGDRLGSGDLGMVEDRTVNHQSANSSRSVVQKVVHQSPTSVLQRTGLQTSDESSGLGGKTTHLNDTNRGGFDYGPHFKSIYEDFERDRVRSGGGGECKCGAKCRRTFSVGGAASQSGRGERRVVGEAREESSGGGGGVMAELENSPIWCIDCQDSLVVVGCANGRMEFWCAGTGQLKFATDEGEGAGLTCVKVVGGGGGGGNQVVAARLNGSLDVYSLSWQRTHAAISLHRRTHIRTGSAGSPLDWTGGGVVGEGSDDQSSFVVVRTSSTRAHQQPITVLDVEGGRVLTGSQDHTLKVMSLLDQVIVYTLHGHCGPITALFIDAITPSTAGSASQDGMLCVWDLLTGACMYSLQAHDGCVTALTYSVSYIISLGADERLCVWERFQGHLLNTIQVSQTYCTSMVMLTHSLLITSKQGSLVVWDVRSGEAVRIVKLGYADNCLFVQHLVPLRMRNSVVCDYGSQLRIVRFPLV